MKNLILLRSKQSLAIGIAAVVGLSAHVASAALRGPYTPGTNTLYLFHFDEAAGGSVTTNVGLKGGIAYSVDVTTATTTPPLVTTLLGGAGYSSGGTNFGNCMVGATTGYLFGYDYDASGAFTPSIYAAAVSPDAVIMTNLNIGNGGQTPFTIEALIAPASIGGVQQEIVCTDNARGTPDRGFQFRINGSAELHFQFVGGPSPDSSAAPVPTSGPHAFVPNNWYHVAVTYDGTYTRLYWTKLDPSVNAANQLGAKLMTMGTVHGAVGGPLIIGNDGRDIASELFTGKIDEVRVSSVCYGAGEMQFYSDIPVIVEQPASQRIDYGQPVTFHITAACSDPLSYTWRTNSVAIPNATNTSFSIASVTPANAGNYDCIVSNLVTGSFTNSQIAVLTVGAPNFLAHRWSFTTDTSDSIGGASGTTVGAAVVSGGALVLDGSTDTYMQLPAGMLPTSLTAATFDFWATFGANGNNCRVFDFGDTNGWINGAMAPLHYVFFSPRASDTTHALTMTPGENIFEQRTTGNGIFDGQTVHITCVIDPPNQYMAIYTNGVLEVANTNMTVPVSALNSLLCYVGRSLYPADPYLNGSINELRIYNGALAPISVLLNEGLGPDTLASDGPVSIAKDPSDFTCAAGQTATFTSVADGRQPIIYQWYKNGSPIPNATNTTLSFTTVAGDNGASIMVWATNTVGSTVYSDASAAATLTVVTPQTLAWIGSVDFNWDTNTLNWNNGSGAVAFSDFNSVLFDSRGSAQPYVNLAQPVNITGLSVNASGDYILTSFGLNGALSGQGTLLKQGTGRFVLDVTNTCIGPNIIEAGVLQIGNNGTAGSLNSGPITNNGTLSFSRADAVGVGTAIHGTGALTFDGGGSTVLSGTNDYTGSTTLNGGTVNLRNSSGLGTTNAGTVINSGGRLYIDANINVDGEALTLNGGGPTGSGALQKGGAGVTTYNAPISLGMDAVIGVDGGSTLNLMFPVSGSAILTKAGDGTLTLNTPNGYSGGTVLAGGVLTMNTNGALGPGSVTCNTSGRIVLGTGTTFGNTVVANAVNPGTATGFLMALDNTNGIVTTINGSITISSNAATGGHFAGPTSSGYLNVLSSVNMTDGFILQNRLGNVRLSGGGSYQELQVRANTTSIGANNGVATTAILDIGGNGSTTTPTFFDLNGFNQTVAGLRNLVNTNNVGWVTNSSGTQSTLTLNLGATNAHVFQGGIVGNVSLVLSSGTQTLGTNGAPISGIYNYSGNTLINGGTLVLGLGASLPNTPVIDVAAGATLDASAGGLTLGPAQTIKGNGSVAGSAIINGTIAPGASIGTLTFNTLTVAGNLAIEVNKSVSPSNDLVVVNGVLNNTGTGTVTVNNLGPALAAGDTFQVFSQALPNGNAMTVTGAGAVWNNNLALNGTISVASVTVPRPVVTRSYVSAGNVIFNGTNGAAGGTYYILTSTNLLSPISTWVRASTNVFDGSGNFSVTNAITPGAGQRYYLLQLP